MVPTTSIVRLFVDTAKSGALVKFRLLDGNNEEVFSSTNSEHAGEAYLGAATEMAMVHQPGDKDPHKAPFLY